MDKIEWNYFSKVLYDKSNKLKIKHSVQVILEGPFCIDNTDYNHSMIPVFLHTIIYK